MLPNSNTQQRRRRGSGGGQLRASDPPTVRLMTPCLGGRALFGSVNVCSVVCRLCCVTCAMCCLLAVLLGYVHTRSCMRCSLFFLLRLGNTYVVKKLSQNRKRPPKKNEILFLPERGTSTVTVNDISVSPSWFSFDAPQTDGNSAGIPLSVLKSVIVFLARTRYSR